MNAEVGSDDRRWGIGAGTLKVIALLSMFLDHYAAIVIQDYSDQTYALFRSIGRLAFPIFCFLLVVGFERTRNVWHYLLRLLLFAILSEIPFDYGFSGILLDWSSQNVMWTLWIGLATITGMEYLRGKWFAQWLLFALGCLLADRMHTDYGMFGVGLIVLLYLMREHRSNQVLGGSFLMYLHTPRAVPAFLLMGLYNGKRGIRLKYFFYVFYPVHIAALRLVKVYFLQ